MLSYDNFFKKSNSRSINFQFHVLRFSSAIALSGYSKASKVHKPARKKSSNIHDFVVVERATKLRVQMCAVVYASLTNALMP